MKHYSSHVVDFNPAADSKLGKSRQLLSGAYNIIASEDDAKMYIRAKVHMLNEYMTVHKLSGLVIGVSGGVDSAVCLELCKLAKQEGIIKQLDAVFIRDPLSAASEQYVPKDVDVVALELPEQESEWVRGQSISYFRQAALYTRASALTDRGYPAIVVGTINRDEGAFIGYTCKAGDGMVDIQLISDLTKREVYILAKVLGVDDRIIDREPVGDLFDHRTDEQVFGTTYAAVEMYGNYRQFQHELFGGNHQNYQYRDQTTQVEILGACENDDSTDQTRAAFAAVEDIHAFNAHKYMVGSPAVHFDLSIVNVPNGRTNIDPIDELCGYALNTFGNAPNCFLTNQVNLNVWLNLAYVEVEINHRNPKLIYSNPSNRGYIECKSPIVVVKRDWHRDTTCYTIYKQVKTHQKYNEVSQLTTEYGSVAGDQPAGGSARWQIIDKQLATTLKFQLGEAIQKLVFDPRTQTWYSFVGINPYMRLMRYNEGEQLFAHLDGRPVFANGCVSLFTAMTYLNACVGGETYFIDPGYTTGRTQDFDEHIDMNSGVIVHQERPEPGKTIIFNGSEFFHGSRPVTEGHKDVLLTELIYRPVTVPNTDFVRLF